MKKKNQVFNFLRWYNNWRSGNFKKYCNIFLLSLYRLYTNHCW